MILTYVLCACLLICLILSAFFSGSEMAYSAANTIRLENMKDEGNKRAKTALFISENFENALSAILIGNNLVNIAASSIGSVIVYLIFGNNSFAWLSTLVITVLVVIFGETIPKIVSKKKATTKALANAYSVRFLMIVLKPMILITVFFVRLILAPFKGQTDEEENAEESVEELQSIIETAQDEGVFDKSDTEIINNAIDFAEVSAFEVMTARVDVQAIDIDDDFDQILAFVQKTSCSRIPVYQNGIDNIIGVLHLNLFLQQLSKTKQAFDIRPLLMEPCYVYKTMKLPTVLSELRKAKQHLAIVTDEYSGTLGIISMEDVLEQIVGDIWDETDVPEFDVVIKNANEFEVDGDLSIGEFLELAQIDEDTFEAESETLGGWVVEMLEKFPAENDKFVYENLEIIVTAVDGRRVEKILVKKNR